MLFGQCPNGGGDKLKGASLKLDGSCIAGRSSRSLSKAGRAREKLTGGAKVTRETCERAGRYDDAILVKVTIASAS